MAAREHFTPDAPRQLLRLWRLIKILRGLPGVVLVRVVPPLDVVVVAKLIAVVEYPLHEEALFFLAIVRLGVL